MPRSSAVPRTASFRDGMPKWCSTPLTWSRRNAPTSFADWSASSPRPTSSRASRSSSPGRGRPIISSTTPWPHEHPRGHRPPARGRTRRPRRSAPGRGCRARRRHHAVDRRRGSRLRGTARADHVGGNGRGDGTGPWPGAWRGRAVIWVYAICERPEIPAPRRRGLAQAPLEGVSAGDLLAVITRHSHTPAEPAPDALWAHERVVERLMADRAVLPMRFGTTMPDTDARTAAIARPHRELVQRLNAVRGRVELGVRAIAQDGAADSTPPAAPEDGQPRNGRDYLMGKLQEERRGDHPAAGLHQAPARPAGGRRR